MVTFMNTFQVDTYPSLFVVIGKLRGYVETFKPWPGKYALTNDLPGVADGL